MTKAARHGARWLTGVVLLHALWSANMVVLLRAYTGLGVEHILLGVDHLLFVLGLIWLVRSPWMLIKTITAFTVAHSITLAAATLGWVGVPERPVNAAIALSIVFVAVEAVKLHRGQVGLTPRYPWVVAFAFGLLHGLGFASGFMHPILGLDHLVAMIAVGLWGAQLGRPAIWLLPITFPTVMAVGGVLGVLGVPIPFVEIIIAISAIVLGLMVATAARPPLWVAARFGEFYSGLLHPLTALEHAIPWVAVGLLAGWQGRRAGRGMLSVFPAALLAGTVLAAAGLSSALAPMLNLASFIVLGGLIALARPLPLEPLLAQGLFLLPFLRPLRLDLGA